MTKLKLLSSGLVAAAMLTGPAVAREHHIVSRHVVGDRYVTGDTFASTARNASSCIHAPRVGAFATEPWAYEPPCEPSSGYYSEY
jgi:hypothetical protein